MYSKGDRGRNSVVRKKILGRTTKPTAEEYLTVDEIISMFDENGNMISETGSIDNLIVELEKRYLDVVIEDEYLTVEDILNMYDDDGNCVEDTSIIQGVCEEEIEKILLKFESKSDECEVVDSSWTWIQRGKESSKSCLDLAICSRNLLPFVRSVIIDKERQFTHRSTRTTCQWRWC